MNYLSSIHFSYYPPSHPVDILRGVLTLLQYFRVVQELKGCKHRDWHHIFLSSMLLGNGLLGHMAAFLTERFYNHRSRFPTLYSPRALAID